MSPDGGCRRPASSSSSSSSSAVARVVAFALGIVAGGLADDSGATDVAVAVLTLLEQIKAPLALTLMTCWDEDRKWQFADAVGGKYFTSFTGDEMTGFDPDIAAHQTLLVVDLGCGGTGRLLEQAGKWLYLKCRWLVLNFDALTTVGSEMTEEEQLERYMVAFRNRPVLVSSEVFVVIRTEGRAYKFMQIYRISPESPITAEDYGLSANGSIVDLRRQRVTAVRRMDLAGHKLRASMVVTNPDTLNHLTDYKDKHIDTITKVNYLLTNCIAAHLNASIEYSVVSTWGYYNTTTKQWDGMIGELVHDLADIGASPLFFTSDRIAVIEYLAMTSETRSKFIFRSPKLSFTENVFLLPFDDHVWLCIFLVIIISSVLLLVTAFAEWRVPLIADDPTDASILSASYRETLLMIYGATCQQGSSVLPRSLSARTITMIAFTVLMFLYASYSANIVALLQSPSTKIQTLDDLLQSRLKFGVHDTVFNRHYFTHATEKTRRAIYEQKVHRPDGKDSFIPLEDGIDRIRRGLYAFHVEQGVGYKVISETYREDEKCGLQEIQYLQVIDPYYAIRKNSSFKEMIKIGLFRLHEHGIQYRENYKLYTKKPRCSGGGGQFVSVSLVDVEPAALIILWGMGLASLFLVAELTWRRFRKGSVRCKKR